MASTLPRVTHVLDAVGLGPDLSAIPPDVLAAAAERGTLVHAAIDNHRYGVLSYPSLREDVRARVDGYLRFVRETGHRAVVGELTVASAQYGFCGHPDRIGWHGERRTLIDWKTVDRVDTFAGSLQLAAYKLAWEEERPTEPIAQAWIVQLLPGAYKVYDVTEPQPLSTPGLRDARRMWIAALTIYQARCRWRNGA